MGATCIASACRYIPTFRRRQLPYELQYAQAACCIIAGTDLLKELQSLVYEEWPLAVLVGIHQPDRIVHSCPSVLAPLQPVQLAPHNLGGTLA